ncbi:hypothetical protein BDZ88DRAFT_408329 [Geranomyces variabilis]|nr:hypothetical protein BDZ88DRAFT_408329 [Geranomyces variabilis]
MPLTVVTVCAATPFSAARFGVLFSTCRDAPALLTLAVLCAAVPGRVPLMFAVLCATDGGRGTVPAAAASAVAEFDLPAGA